MTSVRQPVPLTLGTAPSAPTSLFAPGHPGFEAEEMTHDAQIGRAYV